MATNRITRREIRATPVLPGLNNIPPPWPAWLCSRALYNPPTPSHPRPCGRELNFFFFRCITACVISTVACASAHVCAEIITRALNPGPNTHTHAHTRAHTRTHTYTRTQYDDGGDYHDEPVSEAVVRKFLDWLGIPRDETGFHWIAEECARAKLASEWEEYTDEEGGLVWEHRFTGETSAHHPNYKLYRAIYDDELALADEEDALADEEDARAEAEQADEQERCLVVIDLPADGNDAEIEAELAFSVGESVWEDLVVQFNLFVDNDNIRCGLLRLVDEDTRADLLEMGALTLPSFGGRSCSLEAVEEEAALRLEFLSRESRCVMVSNLPQGIDDEGIEKMFELCDGKIWSLRIEDLSDKHGAKALIEFTESIAARRALALNMFRVDGRYLHVTLGSSIAT
mmetsp:Transcript_26057/g.60263  ORF Transcript_26057/g.60263 Transcript_26057/m.60263 type:complete len:401 (+) Transcript_26057:394-1596(+)